MPWYKRLIPRRSPTPGPRVESDPGHGHRARSAYLASVAGGLSGDWITAYNRPADDEARADLARQRGRARFLARTNPYVGAFLGQLDRNVIGPVGLQLRSRPLNGDGKIDQGAADMIETAWREFAPRAEVSGLSMRDVLRLMVQGLVRDGEALLRLVPNYPHSPDRFAVQLLDPDLLDPNHNETRPNGNRVSMGVERDAWGRKVAYHIRQPGDGAGHTTRLRLPADELLHLYMPDRPGASRGVSWFAACSDLLRMLDGFIEAELVQKRVLASQMGFLTQNSDGASYEGDRIDPDGSRIMEAEPGVLRSLPPGVSLAQFEPKGNAVDSDTFTRMVMRAIAARLGVSPNTLTGDLERVNYNSLRAGAMADRELWTRLQSELIDQVARPVFLAWLDWWLMRPDSPLPLSRRAKFAAHDWQGRRWQGVDPLKDANANRTHLEGLTRSRSEIIRDDGRDPDAVFQEIAAENARLSELGISLMESAAGSVPAPTDDDDGQAPNAHNAGGAA